MSTEGLLPSSANITIKPYWPVQTGHLQALLLQDVTHLTLIISMSIYPKSSPHLNAFQPKFCTYFSSALNKCVLPASVIILTILGKEYKI